MLATFQSNTLPRLLVALAALTAPAAAQVVYSTDFSDLNGWTVTGGTTFTWAADATPTASFGCGAAPFRSAPACLNYNDGVTYAAGNYASGAVTSPVIALDPNQPVARARFWVSIDHEGYCAFDYTTFRVLDASTGTSLSSHCIPSVLVADGCAWTEMLFPIDPAWGAIQLRFETQSVDTTQNGGRGPYIDDLFVEYECAVNAEVVCMGNPSYDYPWIQNGLWGARLDADGSPSISGGQLHATATSVPGPGVSILLAGLGPRGTGTAIGRGTLCIDRSRVRRVGIGSVSGVTDTVNWSVPLGGAGSPLGFVVSGDRLILQGYYRDGGSSNLTDAVVVRFCP